MYLFFVASFSWKRNHASLVIIVHSLFVIFLTDIRLINSVKFRYYKPLLILRNPKYFNMNSNSINYGFTFPFGCALRTKNSVNAINTFYNASYNVFI